jgi:hypothetical protein
MKTRAYGTCLALSLAAVLALALLAGGRARAQNGRQRSTFAMTMTGGLPAFFAVPVDPPILSIRQRLFGTSDFFGGPVTLVEKHVEHLSAFQSPIQFTDGVGVLSQVNGPDALFIAWNGVDRSGQDPLRRSTEGVATVTGGRGRFSGATGQGTLLSDVDLRGGVVTIQTTLTVEY